jgi:hypothetical protein
MTIRPRSRVHALAPLWAILLAGTAVLAAVVPVAAKEGAQAQLTTTIPRDAKPGSTLLVEWDAFMPSPVRRDPILGSQILIRLLPAGAGKAVETRGFEEPSLSGHYAAKIRVPDSGIGGVQIALFGEMCEAGKACVRNDIVLLLVGPVMTTSADPAAAKVVATAAPAATAAAPAPVATAAPPVTVPVAEPAVAASPGSEPGWLAAVAVIALAVVGLLAAASLIRRRGAPPSSLSSDATRT